MYRQLPMAIIAATEAETLTHGQVMYGLVKPTKDMDQVESTAAMVNVIPKKRTYLMTSATELDLFMDELKKRPLVLQPSAYIGHGIAAINCAFCTSEEKWIILVNQSHPKIASRIQMGVDMARAKMEKGEPFVLQLSFNEFLTQSYANHLTRAALNTTFMFINFEDAEIVVRYPGSRSNRTSMLVSTPEMRFTFDDILPSEITRRTVNNANTEWSSPALRVIPPDELSGILHGWAFEMIDPLEGAVYPDEEEEEEEMEGAVGGADPASEPLNSDRGGGGGGGERGGGGRMLGRAARRAQAAGNQMTTPVELHVTDPDRNAKKDWAPPSYEDLDRSTHVNEHAYAHEHYTGAGSYPIQRQPHSHESPYEEMNVNRHHGRSPHSPHGPHTSNVPQSPHGPRTPNTPLTLSAPQMPRTPRTPSSPRTPGLDVSPRSPRLPNTPKIPVAHRVQPAQTHRSQHLPSSPHDQYGIDKQAVDSRKTYLTDENDDGGFSQQRSPRVPQEHLGNKHDSNFNREMDRYGDHSGGRGQYMNPSDRYADHPSGRGQIVDPADRYADRSNERRQVTDPSDRYADHSHQRRQFVDSSDRYADNNSRNYPRERSQGQNQYNRDQSARSPNKPQSERPTPTPRGFHRQQGSGRSDTSASDSGFGEIDAAHDSRYRRDKYSGDAGGSIATKVPYYNHAFEKDSPEKEKSVMGDLMGKHRVQAARQHQGQNMYNGSQPGYDGGNYGEELQRWRRNINDLEDACDDPRVDFSQSRLQVEDKVEESFI